MNGYVWLWLFFLMYAVGLLFVDRSVGNLGGVALALAVLAVGISQSTGGGK